MEYVLHPWQVFVLAIAAWINREQDKRIEHLRTENQILREKLGQKRILLDDDQRRRLAVKGKVLGRKALFEVASVVSPDTILRWHGQLVARKWDYSEGRASRASRASRPRVRSKVARLIIRYARENPSWGYDRIQGALKNVGHHLSDSMAGNILKKNGIEPASSRERRTSWKTFLKSHWDVMGAADFTTVEVWTPWGLETYYILVVMKLSTRKIQITGISPNPDGAWMQQMGRNLIGYYDGFLLDTRYLILDHDTKFLPMCGVFEGEDIEVVMLPPRSPNLNAYMERFMRTIKSECLNKMIFFGKRPLRRAVSEFAEHYHTERNHQGIGNNIIEPDESVGRQLGELKKSERLGGLLSYYYRDAA